MTTTVESLPRGRLRELQWQHPIQEALRRALGIRIPVVPVPTGSLPRYELKARRVRRLGDRPRSP